MSASMLAPPSARALLHGVHFNPPLFVLLRPIDGRLVPFIEPLQTVDGELFTITLFLTPSRAQARADTVDRALVVVRLDTWAEVEAALSMAGRAGARCGCTDHRPGLHSGQYAIFQIDHLRRLARQMGES